MNTKRIKYLTQLLGYLGAVFFSWAVVQLAFYVLTGSGPEHMAKRIVVALLLTFIFWIFTAGCATALAKAQKKVDEAKAQENLQK